LSIPYFDAHCDTISRCKRTKEPLRDNGGQLDLKRLSRFARAAQVFAVFCDGAGRSAEELFAETRTQQSLFAREVSMNAELALPCRSRAEVEAANAAGKIAALLSVEGGELLDCDPERLDWAASAGVVFVNLTWNHANALCGSHREDPERGLSERGRAFVRRLYSLGILPDVSHCSDAGFWDLIRMGEGPVVATHSDARAVCAHTRNLTDDMFRALCECGGVAGFNFYAPFVSSRGAATLDDAVRHVEHWLALGGEKHIGLGGDWDGCDALAGDLRGAQDVPLLWEELARRGYERPLLEDLFYNNWLSVLK